MTFATVFNLVIFTAMALIGAFGLRLYILEVVELGRDRAEEDNFKFGTLCAVVGLCGVVVEVFR